MKNFLLALLFAACAHAGTTTMSLAPVNTDSSGYGVPKMVGSSFTGVTTSGMLVNCPTCPGGAGGATAGVTINAVAAGVTISVSNIASSPLNVSITNQALTTGKGATDGTTQRFVIASDSNALAISATTLEGYGSTLSNTAVSAYAQDTTTQNVLKQVSGYAAASSYSYITIGAAGLGITLGTGLTIAANSYISFTVDVQGYDAATISLGIDVSATAVTGAIGFGALPLDASGNQLFVTPYALTATSSAQNGFFFTSPTATSAGFD